MVVVVVSRKTCETVCAQLCLTLCSFMDGSLPDSSMDFSRQEYWSRLLCPSPGDLCDPGIEPMSLACIALAGGFFTTRKYQ